jgi:hypothetical protein
MAAVNLENTFWTGLLGRSACDSVGNITRGLSGFFIYGMPFNHKSLFHIGKVEIIVQFGGSPYLPGLNPSMVGGII